MAGQRPIPPAILPGQRLVGLGKRLDAAPCNVKDGMSHGTDQTASREALFTATPGVGGPLPMGFAHANSATCRRTASGTRLPSRIARRTSNQPRGAARAPPTGFRQALRSSAVSFACSPRLRRPRSRLGWHVLLRVRPDGAIGSYSGHRRGRTGNYCARRGFAAANFLASACRKIGHSPEI